MNKFQVLSIEDMIYKYPTLHKEYTFKEGDIQIITITKNKYNYPFKPLLILKFDDVTPNDINTLYSKTKLINKNHIKKIKEKLADIEKAHLVYVCCDAGISRSPAVAKALAHYFGDIKSYSYLSYRYPFANSYVFETVLLGLKNK